METGSPLRQAKKIETSINLVLRKFDLYKLSAKDRDVVANLRQNLNDIRIYVNDYELSETREEQLKNARLAKKWLKEAQKNLLAASQFNFFSAIDVAELSAKIDHLTEEIK